MSQRTDNYGLIKPADTDFYNIADFNSNSDIIDSVMKANSENAENALARVNEYGVFVDSAANAANGYWFKMFEAFIQNTTDSNFSFTLLVQDMYGSGTNQYPTGLLDMNINIKSGLLDSSNTRLKWLCANKDVSGFLDYFVIHINFTDKSNVVASLYIYNAARYRSVKVTNVSSGPGIYSDQILKSTYYKYNGHSGVGLTPPITGSLIYSTAGEYMHLLSSSVQSSSESAGATSKAVKTAYDIAVNAQTLATNAVSKSGDTMFGNLLVKSGGIVVGQNSFASGNHAFAQGSNCTASADYTSAMGRDNVASALGAHATGASNTSSGPFSSSVGSGNTAAGYASWAGGMGNAANLCCEFVTGRWNRPSSGSNTSWTSTGNALVIGNGNNLIPGNSLRVTNNGEVYALSAFNSAGADYAEYFEWLDGNIMDEDRIGYFVALDNGRIRIANESDEYILGAVSAIPGVIGNSCEDAWKGMYLTDKWGRALYEDVSIPAVTQTIHHEAVTDSQGNIVIDAWDEELEIAPASTEYRLAVNPDYDPDAEYVPRSQRKEWCLVGLLGRLKVYNDGSCKAGGFCRPNAEGIATASDSGYAVIDVDGEIAEILLR